MNPHFIVHEPKDSVGVVVVDQIGAGEEVSGWVMAVSYTHLTLPTIYSV